MQEFLKNNQKYTGGKKLEQVILEEGTLLSTASGISMLPCIRPGKDILHLIYPEKPPEKYDVILYKRRNGNYILHRVMEVNESKYVLCGDNQYILEYGIDDTQVLGILKGFYREEHYVDCKSSRCYRIYVMIWCKSFRFRKWMLRIMNIGRRGIERWKKI